MDFMARINRRKVTSVKVEGLVQAGAFDSMGYDRVELFNIVKGVVKYYKDIDEYHEKRKAYTEREALRAKLKAEGGSLAKARALKEPTLPTKPTIPKATKLLVTLHMLEQEKNVLGCYMTLHPTDFITDTGDTDQIMNIFHAKQSGKLNGVVCRKREITTRKGSKMAFLEVEDQTGRASVTIFPNVWNNLKVKPESQDFVRIKYTAEDPESTPKRLIANKLRMIQVA
jgi:DNA polymerase-3 subunit alpha